MPRDWDQPSYEKAALDLVAQVLRTASVSPSHDGTMTKLALVHTWVVRVGERWGDDARADLHEKIIALSPGATTLWVGYLSFRVSEHDTLMATIVDGVPFQYDGRKFKALPDDFV